MFGSIINRMILSELFKVFLLALTALTGMFLLAGLIQEASQRGLSAQQVILAIPLLIPSTLPYTIPATTLFATCVIYGRMAHDNEVLVLKSVGVNTLRLLKPAIMLGIMSSAVTMYLYYETIPRTQQMLRAMFMKDAQDIVYGVLKRDRCLRSPGLPYVIFVKDVQGKRLIDVVFKRRQKLDGPKAVNNRFAGYDLVARAREATLRVDQANNQIIIDMEHCTVFSDRTDSSGQGPHPQFTAPLPESIFGRDPKTRPSAMTWPEMRQRRAELEQEVADYNEQIRLLLAVWNSAPLIDPVRDERGLQLASLRHKAKEAARMVLQIDVEMQARPAFAVGCLCFVLIGCPVGIWASRSDYLSTFVVCFLPTIFAYYPLVLCGTNLAKDGKLAPALGIWAADVILGLVSLGLIWRLLRR